MSRFLGLSLILIVLLGAVSTADDPPAPQKKPSPVVLDEATLAKLREIAFQAAREGDSKTLSAYFDQKMPAEIVNDKGDTLLILASYHGHDDAVRIILDQPRTPIEARNKMGFTAITGAAFRGHLGVVKQLVKKGANLNASNDRGQTPLMFASMFGRLEVVAFLVESKVDLALRDSEGRDALTLAEQQGRKEVAALLRGAARPKDKP